jgi:hypothetical protein
MNEYQVRLLNECILDAIREGDRYALGAYLKDDNCRQFIMLQTWGKVAKWIEEGCKKPKGRPATGESTEIKARNRMIKRKYRLKRAEGKKPSQCYDELLQEYTSIGMEQIITITGRK